jgi:hypothetical protein
MGHIERINLTQQGILPSDRIFLVITTDDSDDGRTIYYLDEV